MGFYRKNTNGADLEPRDERNAEEEPTGRSPVRAVLLRRTAGVMAWSPSPVPACGSVVRRASLRAQGERALRAKEERARERKREL